MKHGTHFEKKQHKGNHNLQQKQKSEVGSPHYIYFIIQYRWNHGFSTKHCGRDRNLLTFCGVTQVPFCCKGRSLGQWLDWGPPRVDEVRVKPSPLTHVFLDVFFLWGGGYRGTWKIGFLKGKLFENAYKQWSRWFKNEFCCRSQRMEWYYIMILTSPKKSKLKMLQNMILNLPDFVKDHSPR